MSYEFFTDNFRFEEYDSALNSSFQGQLASKYTGVLTELLMQADVADWLAYLAHTDLGLSIDEALALRVDIQAGNFTLGGLFGAAQSKTGEVDGLDITDPTPTLTVNGHTIDLTKILSDLDTETWTQTDTTGGGKKNTVTETTYHTREFYTDADEPDGYTSDWADENTGHWESVTVTDTFTKGSNNSASNTTFNFDFDLLGDTWQNVTLTVTGQGDYDGGDEGVTLSGDVNAAVFSATVVNGGADVLPNDQIGPEVFNVASANYADGDVAGTVVFADAVNVASDPSATVTLTLQYEYWVI